MEEVNRAGDRSDGAWYVFAPAIGYARNWEGKPLAAPPREDPGKASLGGVLKDFAGALFGQIKRDGALPFNRLWCSGSCERVFIARGTPENLEKIEQYRRRLNNLEEAVREWAPRRCGEVASQWRRFRPAGHVLVMEARPVFLPGEEAAMRAEAGEIFREAYGGPGIDPSLAELTEASKDDPDRWYVIIGWLKLAGLDGFRSAEIDSLNWDAPESPAASADRERAEVLVKIFTDVAPEFSTGAWFDLDDVHRAWALERERGGLLSARFEGVERLGSHLNFFWCNGPKGIKGPYFLPRGGGIAARLSERRRAYRRAIAERAAKEGVEVRSLMLFFEVKSPWLGEPVSDDSRRLHAWFAGAKRGASLLNELYWETPWGWKFPFAAISAD